MTRTISRILVATDFSAASDLAIDYARALATQFGASVHLVHVVEDPFVTGTWHPEVYIASIPGMRATLIDDAAARVARLKPIFDAHGVSVTSEVMVGTPASAICDAAVGRRCDLIVMGTHGHSALGNIVLGSVTTGVLAHCRVPVLLIR